MLKCTNCGNEDEFYVKVTATALYSQAKEDLHIVDTIETDTTGCATCAACNTAEQWWHEFYTGD